MKDTKLEWGTCRICQEHGWMNRHKCPPSWQVVPLDELPYTHDDLDYWTDIYADDTASAATKYIERMDRKSAEFSEVAFVVVRDPEEPDIMVYHQVEGRLDPVYEAITQSLDESRAKYIEWFSFDPF